MMDFETYDSLQGTTYLSILNVTKNHSEMAKVDLFEAYSATEKEQLMVYKSIGYIIGTLIILSNVTVVISSGLILKKGQQQKSTYLLLGNVSLADTIVGFSIIFGTSIDNSVSSNMLCIFQMGMIVCPAMVSIFSVGLIAVDRYIYILHGLYYQRWFNTTRVRIGILCIWMISLTLGFMPATGWVNDELILSRCYYVALFPGTLILLNSLLSIIPIIVVAVLYSIILVQALKTVNNLNAAVKKIEKPAGQGPKLRMYRGSVTDRKTITNIVASPTKTGKIMKRSASCNLVFNNGTSDTKHAKFSVKSISADDLNNDKTNTTHRSDECENIDIETNKDEFESKFSVYTVESNKDFNKVSYTKKSSNDVGNNSDNECGIKSRKIKEPNKWRAITVVMLTSGSFIFTWLPFFVAVIFFVFCEEKLTNPKCMYIRTLLGGPLATLAFFNSILNPLIYAWWHKGFQRSVRTYYRKYFHKIFE